MDDFICEVFDDIFSFDELTFIDDVIKDTPVSSNNLVSARRKENGAMTYAHRFFGKEIFSRENINRVTKLDDNANLFFDYFEKIQEKLNRKFYLKRIDINLQHAGCDGTPHIDGQTEHEKTILLMTTCEWNSEWGGQFQLIANDMETVVEEYEYKPGRVIIIPSNHLHRGLGPKINFPYVYRTSVVFRTQPLVV